MVEFVFAVVREKKLQALADDGLIDRFAAERALNQNRSPVAHVASDHIVGQFGTSDVAQGGVDGVH